MTGTPDIGGLRATWLPPGFDANAGGRAWGKRWTGLMWQRVPPPMVSPDGTMHAPPKIVEIREDGRRTEKEVLASLRFFGPNAPYDQLQVTAVDVLSPPIAELAADGWVHATAGPRSVWSRPGSSGHLQFRWVEFGADWHLSSRGAARAHCLRFIAGLEPRAGRRGLEPVS